MNVPAFIGTLGMQLIVYGVCLVYTKAEPIGGYRTAYTTVATGNFLKIPYLFIYAFKSCRRASTGLCNSWS